MQEFFLTHQAPHVETVVAEARVAFPWKHSTDLVIDWYGSGP